MYAIVDVETTGLNPHTDRMIEIAIITYDGSRVETRFQSLVHPDRSLPSTIVDMTGIDAATLVNAPRFYEIAREIVELTRDRVLIGHNVRFDAAFLRREFSQLGYHFRRKLLCTLRMSRRLMPNLPSYRLAGLCRHLDLQLPGNHRALDDAEATLLLFEHLRQQTTGRKSTEELCIRAVSDVKLPATISREQIDAIPDDTGVYRFYDERKRLIYVGKSINIRKRILDHFANDLHSSKSRLMKDEIHSIDHELTGSELVALLLESDLIKKHQPAFNASQRRTRYELGLVVHKKDEYLTLDLARMSPQIEAIVGFSNRWEGEKFLKRLIERYGLCQKYCNLHHTRGPCFNYHIHKCSGACAGKESADDYNRRVQKALRKLDYMLPSFFVIGKGRCEKEHSVVCVENGSYCGFGYATKKRVHDEDLSSLRACIEPRADNQDIRRIIRGYLDRNDHDQVLEY